MGTSLSEGTHRGNYTFASDCSAWNVEGKIHVSSFLRVSGFDLLWKLVYEGDEVPSDIGTGSRGRARTQPITPGATDHPRGNRSPRGQPITPVTPGATDYPRGDRLVPRFARGLWALLATSRRFSGLRFWWPSCNLRYLRPWLSPRLCTCLSSAPSSGRPITPGETDRPNRSPQPIALGETDRPRGNRSPDRLPQG